MRILIRTAGFVGLLTLAAGAQTPAPRKPAPRAPAMAVSHAPSTMTPDAQKTLITQYCAGCHNDRAKTGGLTLASFDPAHADQTADTAEKMIRKLRAGMMPP